MKVLIKQNSPLKVLHLLQGLNIGGLEKVVISLVKRVDKERYTPSLCCFDNLGPLVSSIPKGIKVHLLQRKQGIDYWYPLKLARLLKSEGIQILHLHNSTAFFYGTIAGKIARIPAIIYTEHARDSLPDVRIRITEKVLSYFIDKAVVVADYLKHNLIKYQWFNPLKITVIPNGVDEEEFKDLPEGERVKRELGLSPDQKVIGMIARLDPIKNHWCLLRAMQRIAREFQNVVLLIVGDGPLKEELISMIRDYGLQGRVFLLGARDDIPRILTAIDIFVICSKSEGLPMTLIEAMASGKAIVASRIGGIPEIIKNKINGILVSSGNPEELAESISSLINKPELMEELGLVAKKTFCSRFTLQSMVQSYEDIYMKIFFRKCQKSLNSFQK